MLTDDVERAVTVDTFKSKSDQSFDAVLEQHRILDGQVQSSKVDFGNSLRPAVEDVNRLPSSRVFLFHS